MRRPKKFHRAAAACLLVLGVFASVQTHRAASSPWLILKSPHFILITDTSERNGREKLEDMERFQHAMMGEGMRNPLPTRVYLFRRGRDLERVGSKTGRGNLAGHFRSSPFENFLAVDDADDTRSRGTVRFHELGHLLFRDQLRNWPHWLSEGMAEAFSTVKFEPQRVRFGDPPEYYAEWVKRFGMIPLDTFFSVDFEAQRALSERQEQTFYVESWLLAHYLMFGLSAENRAKLGKFFEQIDMGAASAAAIEVAFGWDSAALKARMHGYARAGRFNYRRAEFDKTFTIPITARAATPGEASAWIGRALLVSGNTNEATAEFELMQKAASDAWYTHLHLGLAEIEAKRYVEGANLIRRTLKVQPDDYDVHIQLARCLLRDGGLDELADTSPVATEARATLKEVLRLKPDYQPAYRMLGMLELSIPRHQQAAYNALERAILMDPYDYQSRLLMTKVMMEGGHPDTAHKHLLVLDKVLANHPLHSRVRELLKELDRKQQANTSVSGSTRKP